MTQIQKLGGIAAFVNVLVSMATLITVVFLIGISAIANPNRLIDMAIHNPTPLLIADSLKLISAGASVVLILALANYLGREGSLLLSMATGFGLLSVLCLIGNAILSVYVIIQVSLYEQGQFFGDPFNRIIGILAVAAISLDGLWLLLLNWVALKHQQLPRLLCYLGMGMGVLSLVPPLGIVVLLLSVIWSMWIGKVLLTKALGDSN
jgi:hypothetical protein